MVVRVTLLERLHYFSPGVVCVVIRVRFLFVVRCLLFQVWCQQLLEGEDTLNLDMWMALVEW